MVNRRYRPGWRRSRQRAADASGLAAGAAIALLRSRYEDRARRILFLLRLSRHRRDWSEARVTHKAPATNHPPAPARRKGRRTYRKPDHATPDRRRPDPGDQGGFASVAP